MGAPKIDVNTLNESDRAAIEARRAYQKRWRAANKERIKEYDRRHWLKKAAEMNAGNAENQA